MEKTESEKEMVRKFYMVLRTCLGAENGVGKPSVIGTFQTGVLV